MPQLGWQYPKLRSICMFSWLCTSCAKAVVLLVTGIAQTVPKNGLPIFNKLSAVVKRGFYTSSNTEFYGLPSTALKQVFTDQVRYLYSQSTGPISTTTKFNYLITCNTRGVV